jgi:hypothetical protein
MVTRSKMFIKPACRREDFKGEPSPHPRTLLRTWSKAALACGRVKTMVNLKRLRKE